VIELRCERPATASVPYSDFSESPGCTAYNGKLLLDHGTERGILSKTSTNSMNVVIYASALSVAMLFYAWRSYHEKIEQREKNLAGARGLHAVGHGEFRP